MSWLLNDLHLKRDVGLWPVFDVGEQQVRVSVDEVDAEELFAARPAEPGQTLARCSTVALHTGGAILTEQELTAGRSPERHFTQPTAATTQHTQHQQQHNTAQISHKSVPNNQKH